jgi:hypothetical protein
MSSSGADVLRGLADAFNARDFETATADRALRVQRYDAPVRPVRATITD